MYRQLGIGATFALLFIVGAIFTYIATRIGIWDDAREDPKLGLVFIIGGVACLFFGLIGTAFTLGDTIGVLAPAGPTRGGDQGPRHLPGARHREGVGDVRVRRFFRFYASDRNRWGNTRFRWTREGIWVKVGHWVYAWRFRP